jgi:hypothetical protein
MRYWHKKVSGRYEIVLRHAGFLIFRIHKTAFPDLIRRYGEDLLSEAILITYKKIDSYDLNVMQNAADSGVFRNRQVFVGKRIIDGTGLKKLLNTCLQKQKRCPVL